ncbi:GTP-binding protein [Microbacterium imperiale]|uniref:GTP-binding protein n=1 Tax=Microbacterium imperiale TaxID=33884 RepID=UPI001AE4C218|nr:GTP-binding protein [Microbacterium imperiale]MBP2421855.1 G3E family GTPase [Microbacterium imperiale]MDS0199044.1 cobalamin biosynthesis protein CobW [Microbacterium imperiale]
MTTHLAITGVCSAERRRYARLGAAAGRHRSLHVIDLPSAADPLLVHSTLHGMDTLCVVDARHALDDLRDDAPVRRTVPDGDARADVGARARLAAQLIEGASAVVIVNWERLPTADLSILMAVASHLAPTARVRLSRGVRDDLAALGFGTTLPVGPRDDRAGWTRVLNGEHEPFLTDRRVTTLRYEQLRPFHPARLVRALEILDSGACGILLRSVGVCRLATRAGTPARWEQAGSAMWIDPLDAGHGLDDVGQDLAMTGIDLNPGRLRQVLDEAVLDDGELAAGPARWRTLPDPLPDWHQVVGSDDGSTA